jgi:ATP-binding protein involved in chromosome partitioning
MDAQKGIEMFRKVDIPILGVVENMAVHICSKCGHREHIFGADGGQRIATEYGVALLGSLPLSLSIREQTDSGRPTVVAEPDSPEAAIYLEIAEAIEATLAAGGAGAADDFPAINISDD